MNQKEKAIYLFKQFDSILIALFVCEQMINEYKELTKNIFDFNHNLYDCLNYWKSVKYELELL